MGGTALQGKGATPKVAELWDGESEETEVVDLPDVGVGWVGGRLRVEVLPRQHAARSVTSTSRGALGAWDPFLSWLPGSDATELGTGRARVCKLRARAVLPVAILGMLHV